MTVPSGSGRQRPGFRPRHPGRGFAGGDAAEGTTARPEPARWAEPESASETAPPPETDTKTPPDRDADPAAVARAIVLRQLTAAPKSRLQLSRKLAERNVPDDVAEAVLDRFEEVHLVNDAEFAEMWVRSRSQSRRLAKGALRRELADKGIDPETAAAALEQLSDEDEEAAARELVERKLRGAQRLADRAERDKATRRLASMLARKGYQPSQAFRIVGEVLDAAAGAEPDA